jgi:FkbM family methyltransferase
MQTKLGKYKVKYFNQEEYHLLKKEIFTNNCYYFDSDTPNPYIIDVGAYIGLSVLYFKREYPNSKITAFEPNPFTLELLKENIFNNNIEDVDIHNSAIWINDCNKNIFVDNTGYERFSVASFLPKAWSSNVESSPIEVECEKLDPYLNNVVDLLKLDIEGAEQKVLKSIQKYFIKIKNIIVEFHPTQNQDIDKFISILKPYYNISIDYEGRDVTKSYPKDKLLTIKATCRR